MSTHELDDETRQRRQPKSPSERIETLNRALREGVSHYDIALRCSISEEVVSGWESTGLYGDRSLAAIEDLIAQNRRRKENMAGNFIEVFKYAGLRTNRDLQLAGFPYLALPPLDGPINEKMLRKLLIAHGGPGALPKLRRYVERFHEQMRAEQRRERRVFGR